jgi:hypothetical protein
MAWLIYRNIQTGPRYGGLPVMQLFALVLSAVFGFFIVRPIFGLLGGLFWVGLHAPVYGLLAFLGSRDAMFVPRFLLMRVGKFYRKLTSFENSRKTWSLLD